MAVTSINSITQGGVTPRSSIFSGGPRAASSVMRVGKNVAPAASSIFRVGTTQTQTTSSVFHPGAIAIGPNDAELDEIRDNIRYDYMREKAQERQGRGGVSVGTGGGFRRKKFHKGMVAMKLLDPGRYKNLSYDDLNYFERLVGGKARLTRAGVGFSRSTKRQMKHQLWNDYKSGTVESKEDWKDMERLIDSLPSSDY